MVSLLEISQASISFGSKVILQNVSLTCQQGEIIGLFGRNGTGKSTLLKVIFGTVLTDSISIKIQDKKYLQKEIIPSRKIGYLPQDTFLPKWKKVRDIIPMFYPDGNEQDKIFYAPKVASFDSRKVGNLSLGQLRYLELILISGLNHSFLLLDEPFSMIEPLYKEHIKDLLLKLKTSKGIVVTDHYYRDVLDIADRNLLLKEAQIITIRSTKDFIDNDYLMKV